VSQSVGNKCRKAFIKLFLTLSPKITILPSGTLSQTLDFTKKSSLHVDCRKLVNSVDRRPSSVVKFITLRVFLCVQCDGWMQHILRGSVCGSWDFTITRLHCIDYYSLLVAMSSYKTIVCSQWCGKRAELLRLLATPCAKPAGRQARPTHLQGA